MQNKSLNLYRHPRINSLIFKLTDNCNLGCSYCYRGSNKEKPKTIMSNNLIYMTIKKFVDFKKENNILNEPIVLIWHGGEPLIAGINKFKEILKIEKSINKDNSINFINSVQTNGTLINDEFAQFFKDNNFIVGFSLDGPKFIQDMNRYNKNKQSSFNSTLNGIKTLQKYGIHINTIGVITNESSKYPDQIYNFLKQSKINTIDLIPSFYYDSEVTLESRKYTDFMIKILNLWKEDKYKPLKIRFLNDAFKRVLYRNTNKQLNVECELAGCCGQNFSIGVNGEVYPCECLTPVNSFELGNILDSDFRELLEANQFNYLKKSFNNVSNECYDCDCLDLCRGGCLNRRLEIHNLNNGKDVYCESRREIFKAIDEIIKNEEIVNA